MRWILQKRCVTDNALDPGRRRVLTGESRGEEHCGLNHTLREEYGRSDDVWLRSGQQCLLVIRYLHHVWGQQFCLANITDRVPHRVCDQFCSDNQYKRLVYWWSTSRYRVRGRTAFVSRPGYRTRATVPRATKTYPTAAHAQDPGRCEERLPHLPATAYFVPCRISAQHLWWKKRSYESRELNYGGVYSCTGASYIDVSQI
nr:hypothetical protein CFP56_73651 [Quercus suber]